MTVTLGHFDIWDIWDLQVFWKMSVPLLVHRWNWWEWSRKCSQIPLKAWIHPPTLPKHPWTLQNTSLGGVGGCKWAQDGVWLSFPLKFPPISSNFTKSRMRSLTFSSTPGGPRCLKYQNVPKLRSFWATRKPGETFQSWDIRVYFNSVPNDHTVAPDTETVILRHSTLTFRWSVLCTSVVS